MVDPHIVEQKLHDLDRYLKHLEKYKGTTAQELERNLDLAWIIEHGKDYLLDNPPGAL